MRTDENKKVELKDKYLLSIEEASIYFGIGHNKIRTMVSIEPDASYLLHIGRKVLIKRKLFEQMIDDSYSI